MFKLFKKKLLISAVCSIMFLLPQISFAAELNFKVVKDDITKDGSVLVDVNIDPQSKRLNVVEGTIKFEGEGVKDLSVEVLSGESMLTMWPTAPVYLPKEKAIRFTGGVPGGFDKEGLLFRISLTSTLIEGLNILWIDGTAYLNDGKGTKEMIIAKDITINQNTLEGISNSSTDKPNRFNVILLIILVMVFIALFLYVQKKK